MSHHGISDYQVVQMNLPSSDTTASSVYQIPMVTENTFD